jgi:hypothetical protein
VAVGLLVNRHGFPLEIGCFEGNRVRRRRGPSRRPGRARTSTGRRPRSAH